MVGCNRNVTEWNTKSYVEFKTLRSGAIGRETEKERGRGPADDVEFIIRTTIFLTVAMTSEEWDKN